MHEHACSIFLRTYPYVPDVQSLHAVLPEVEVNVPALQSSQVSCLGLAEYEPGRQGTGFSDPTLQLVPAGQMTH